VRLVPALPESAPRWGNVVTRGIGRIALRVGGWRIEGEVPDVPKAVAIGAPHTAAADAFLGLWGMLALGIRLRWLGKHTIFRGPLGTVLRVLGGIAVDRSTPGGLVGEAVRLMRASERCFLALAPEGTRQKVERWRTGFYHVALACEVPIVPVALDYRRHVLAIGSPLMPTGDYEADLARIQSHFSADMARHPERY
jgi:1-acyl-sn-glycerol-3-phosphate acyltransferase